MSFTRESMTSQKLFSILRLRAKASWIIPTFCLQNDSSVSLFSFHVNISLLAEQLQQFPCRTIPVNHWNRFASVSLFWFCFSIMLDLFFIHHHASSKPNNHLQNCASKLLGSLCSHSKAEKHWNHSFWQNINIIELALALIIKSAI